MAAPTPLGVHQIASGETYALVADLNRVGVTADAAIAFVKARAEYLTDKAVADAGALSRRALNELPGRVVAEVDRVIGDTREDAAEALTVAQQAYEYNQALVAPAAAVVNAVVTDPATPAGAAVAAKLSLSAADSTRPVYTSSDGDLQTWVSTVRTSKVLRVTGSHTVSGTITVPAGVTLDLRGATITQAQALTSTLSLGAGAHVVGGTIIGYGAGDYVPGENRFQHFAGVEVLGSGAQVTGTTIKNVSGAGIYVRDGHDRVTITGCTITAPAMPFARLDSNNFGVYTLGADCTITGCTLTDLAMGVITGKDSSGLILMGNHIGRIRGQHGAYVQSGTRMVVAGNDIFDVMLNGVKVQLPSTGSLDSVGWAITGNTVRDCKDTGLILATADPAKVAVFRGGAMSGNVISGCGRGILIENLRGATIASNDVRSCGTMGLDVRSCEHVEVSGLRVEDAGQNGIIVQSFAPNKHLSFTGIRIHNAGRDNTPGNRYGIYLLGGSHITIAGATVTADNGTMEYPFFVGDGDQATLTLRDLDLSGGTGGYAARLLNNPIRPVREWTNVRLDSLVANKPTGGHIRSGSVGTSAMYSGPDAAPTSGVFELGDQITNSTPAQGSPKGWTCTRAGGGSEAQWSASTPVKVGVWWRNSSNRIYECVKAGTTGSVEPTNVTIGATHTDGTVTWRTRHAYVATWVSQGNLG